MSLVGTVNDVVGDVVRAATYSRVGPKHRLAAWVRLLAVSAGQPAPRFSAATIGRGRRRRRRRHDRTDPGGHGDRTARRARRPPRPRDARAAAAVLRHVGTPTQRRPRAAAACAPARSGRRRSGGFDREDRDAAHLLVLGDDVAFDDVERPAPAPDECGPGWHDDVDSRFGRYALRLWEGLLAAEQRSGL